MNILKHIALWKRTWRKKKHPDYNAVSHGSVFFSEFAAIYGNSIDNLDKLDEFMKDFMNETGGCVNADMLDTENWDCIKGYSIDKEKELLHLYWKVKEDDPEFAMMRKIAFKWDVYGLTIQFKNVQFIKDKNGRCFAICINGYTIPDSDIKKIVKSFDAAKSRVDSSSSFFSTDYIRADVEPTEQMRILKTPIKSFWLIPKDLRIQPQKSKELLYKLNLDECERMVNEALEDLKTTIKHHQRNRDYKDKAIKIAGNQIRQACENLFKLMMCFYHEDYNFKPQSYNDRLLSDAVNPIKSKIYTSDEDRERFGKIAKIANKCSHFTGLPVKFSELMELSLLAKYYIGDFSAKIENYNNSLLIEQPDEKKLPSPEGYIKDNYLKMDFNNAAKPFRTITAGKMSYLISFKIQGEGHVLLLDGYYLCQDGHICLLKENDLSKAMYFWSRDEVLQAKDAILKQISEQCVANGYDGDNLCLYIYIGVRANKESAPSHLFTEDEVKSVMAAGDDNVNNRLVIDEEGYVRLIQDTHNGHLYPVYQETWGAGENAVGVTSPLSQVHDSYVTCMNSWLHYLESGETIYADDYYDDSNIDDIVKRVKSHYVSDNIENK